MWMRQSHLLPTFSLKMKTNPTNDPEGQLRRVKLYWTHLQLGGLLFSGVFEKKVAILTYLTHNQPILRPQ